MSTTLAASDQWRDTIERVYRADAERLWRALVAFSGDADVASEAVAEAYAQALRRGSAIRDPSAWTWYTGFRIARGALQARRSAGSAGGDRDADEPGLPDRYVDPDLHAALRRLPDAQRAAVILYYYADLPVREIAARLGSNQLAVRTNLSRGRRRLRGLLGDDHG